MKEELQKWHSPSLNREMETLVFGHSGYPIILFPTSMGRYYENKDFKLIESVQNFIEEGKIKIYCPDGIDSLSWYNKNIHPSERVKNHIWYDKFLLEELLPLATSETGRNKVITAGCSFGGYHAANFAFRHPGYVSHLFSMSGAFDIRSFMDGYQHDDIYYNSPLEYLPGLQDGELWNMGIALGTSNWDICYDANLKLHEVLKQKNINHWLDVRQDRQHDWPVWKEMFPHYLSTIKFT